MAVTEIQSGNNSGSSTSASLTLAAAPTVGNLLVVYVGCTIVAGDVTITMPVGWTQLQTKVTATKVRQTSFYKNAGASESATITATLTAARAWSVCVVEAHSTSAGGWTVDKQASNNGSSTSPSSGTTATTTQAEEYWTAGFTSAINQNLTSPTNSFTVKEQKLWGSGGLAMLTRIVAATATASTGGTYASSAVWVGTVDTFKAAAATITVGGAALSGRGTLRARANYATPTLSVLAAFGYTPTSPVPVWTDISSYGRTFTWQRGKQNELNQLQAGTASLTLKDPLSYFDPSNTASPFYPNVKPGLPIRAVLLVGSTMYPLFYGFAERLPRTARVSSVYTERQIDLTDGFALLAYAGLGGASFPQQTSDQRVSAVLDYIGWPTLQRVIGTGSETLQDVAFPAEDTTTAQAHLQAVADSEDGLLYVDGANNVVFVGRAALAAPPYTVSTVTYSDV
jgi:hypothetical protein